MNTLLQNMESIIRALGYILGFGLPVFILAFMLFIGIPMKILLRSAVFYVLALSGPVLVLLWYLYNGILKWQGFDSVMGLLLNLLLFCILGILAGAGLRFFPKDEPRLTPYFLRYLEKLNLSEQNGTLSKQMINGTPANKPTEEQVKKK